MRFLVVLAVAVACASADVSHLKDDENAHVVSSSSNIQPEGNYEYAFETSNGILQKASGILQIQNSEYPSLAVKGGFKYTAPDGTPVELVYTADENGFNPKGSHLPVAPEIPDYIQRSLAYIESHPPPAESAARPSGAKPNYG